MQSFLQRFAELRGLAGMLTVFALGAAAALAMPPTLLWPLLPVVLPLLLIRFGTETTFRGAFFICWMFGFGYFCVALHWIGFAFLVEASTYLWMMPFAVGGLAAVMAVYWGAAGLATHFLARRGFATWLSLPLMLAIAEWLRGHLMTGFPWAAPGLAADGMGGLAQTASVVGMTGLTLLLLAASAAPFAFLTKQASADRWIAAGLVAILPFGFLWGEHRLAQNPTQYRDGVLVRLVQPNISQDDKWRAEQASLIFDDLIAASTEPRADGAAITHVIWPESAVPFLIDESAGAKAVLRDALAGGKILVTGAIRRAAKVPSSDHYTSVLVFDSQGEVAGTYDKWRLVPGGEYLPFAWLLEPLGFQRLVSLPGSFAAGSGPGSLPLGAAGMAGLVICYEVIFPHQLTDPSNAPEWMINVTNDGWFGTSTGPYQHLAQARMRAIEQGLPLARAANTGISSMFDSLGRYEQILGLGTEGTIDSRLPLPLPTTIYRQSGDWMLALLAGAIAVLQLISRVNCQLRGKSLTLFNCRVTVFGLFR